MRPLIAGNWKMNGLGASLAELELLKTWIAANRPGADILVCPPATLLSRVAAMADGRFAVGGQDCRAEACGAFTGDISAEMLKDAGASSVIVGHSERRQYYGETDRAVAAKAQAAWRAGLMAIICIGETEDQRMKGAALHVCGGQLGESVPLGATPANTAVAYEPVWAIGTGRTPTQDDIAQMHDHIHNCLLGKFGSAADAVRVLYGGSVKPSNAAEILALPHVGGALVGGASLKASDFSAIVAAASAKA